MVRACELPLVVTVQYDPDPLLEPMAGMCAVLDLAADGALSLECSIKSCHQEPSRYCSVTACAGKAFLTADLSIECYDTTYYHYRAVAIIGIIVYPIGMPCLFLAVLWKHRRALAADEADAQAQLPSYLLAS